MRRKTAATIFSALFATLLLLSATPVQAVTVASTWLNAVSGDWTDGTKWSTSPVYPGSGFPAGTVYSASIAATGAPYEVAMNSGLVRLESLSLESSDALLHFRTGAGLALSDSLVLLDATIQFSRDTSLRFSGGGPQNISGTGLMQSSSTTGSTSILITHSLHMEQGITLEAINGLTRIVGPLFENGGILRAEVGATMHLHTDAFENTGLLDVMGTLEIGGVSTSPNTEWTNSGTIRARNGSRLILRGIYSSDELSKIDDEGATIDLAGRLDNTGQTITIDATRENWQFSGIVTGGRIESRDGTPIKASGTWHNVTLAGKAILNVDAPRRAGIFINDTLTLDDGEVLVRDRFGIYGEGAFSINGTGTIVLDAGWIGHYPSSGEFTIGKDVTIRTGSTGGGTIAGSPEVLVNYGLISAETTGRTLTISRPVVNYGTLQNKNQSNLILGAPSWTNDGTILAIGPVSNQGFVTIEATNFSNAETGLIGGTGRLVIPNTTLVNHGTIAPGLSVGTLTIAGNVELTDTSVLGFEIGTGGIADRLVVQGSLELGGTLQLTALPNFSLDNLNPIPFLSTSDGIIQGEFDNVGPIRLGGYDFHIHYGYTTVWLTPSVAEVPEPGCLGMLLAIGVVAAAGFRHRGSRGMRAGWSTGDLT